MPRAFFAIVGAGLSRPITDRSIERETTVSTQTSAPLARAWVSPQNAIGGRTQRIKSAPRQRTNEIDRPRQTRQSFSQTMIET